MTTPPTPAIPTAEEFRKEIESSIHLLSRCDSEIAVYNKSMEFTRLHLKALGKEIDTQINEKILLNTYYDGSPRLREGARITMVIFQQILNDYISKMK